SNNHTASTRPPPPPRASLTWSGSSGSFKANAQHATNPHSATPQPPGTGSKPKVNPLEIISSSTLTNAPTTSPKPSEPTIVNQTSHQCVIASPWPVASAHTSPKGSPTQTRPTAACANPVQAAKHLPPWDDAAENKQLNAGKTQTKGSTKKLRAPHWKRLTRNEVQEPKVLA